MFVQIMVASTAAFLAAGKFGLAPTVKRGTDAGCRLQDRPNAAGLLTNDPSGGCMEWQQHSSSAAVQQCFLPADAMTIIAVEPATFLRSTLRLSTGKQWWRT
jgi:photosystem I reaction center PsaK